MRPGESERTGKFRVGGTQSDESSSNCSVQENSGSPGDSAHGRRCNALDESLHLPVLGEPPIVRRCDDDDEVWWGKHRSGSHERTNWSSNQVADESCGNHYRPRCDHGHRYRVHKLLLREPVEFLDYSTIEKWHDRQTAAKNKSSGLQKKEKECANCGQGSQAIHTGPEPV